MRTHLTFPRILRVQEILSGPAQGWQWTATPDAPDIEVACTGGPVEHVDALAVAMLGAWSHHQRALGRAIHISETLKTPLAYRSGLLSALAGREGGGVRLNVFGRFTAGAHSSGITEALEDVPARVGIRGGAAQAIARHCLSDLVNNVFDHAGTNGQGAFVAMSYDNRSGRVRVAVADCGRGIPADVKAEAPDLPDADALRLALEPEFSGATARPGVNRGVGLYFVRRLTLAADGSLTIYTQNLRGYASARSSRHFEPQIDSVAMCWKGTAVGLTFIAHGADYDGPVGAIKDEIEGRGPRYRDIQFFREPTPESGWRMVRVGPDSGKFALNRERAQRIANESALPALAAGQNVEFDFRGVGMATQAFCHALVVPVLSAGESVLARMRFVGCARSTCGAIRFAIAHALAAPNEVP